MRESKLKPYRAVKYTKECKGCEIPIGTSWPHAYCQRCIDLGELIWAQIEQKYLFVAYHSRLEGDV